MNQLLMGTYSVDLMSVLLKEVFFQFVIFCVRLFFVVGFWSHWLWSLFFHLTQYFLLNYLCRLIVLFKLVINKNLILRDTKTLTPIFISKCSPNGLSWHLLIKSGQCMRGGPHADPTLPHTFSKSHTESTTKQLSWWHGYHCSYRRINIPQARC